MVAKKHSFSFEKEDRTEKHWGSVVFLVKKFIKQHKHLIPPCLSEEDFYQEAWLAKNDYINRYPWQACLRLMKKHSVFSSVEMKDYRESGELPTRELVEIEEAFQIGVLFDFTKTYVEMQTILDVMDKVPINYFTDIFLAYYNGAETEEIAKEFGFGLDRTRHIKSDGLKILKKFLVEMDYEKRDYT